ncbi:3-keto-5-aminohexanoate cleavage protein [Ruegeria sp. 2012CJ41-6]|uniref:3-keto-5-aminohexanoate cleavage protein n=1 Tax=Ruegeria spongiae TaxID=2942209 RepID=A0ABT0Q282_9RHOB|nr:3-keto-5-aminohexanoate cleavage protein [Ruegeria spongiae]MCL6283912.1 3-keto-5-aminohexanoate cleavage protein [Ruegeria spongiae]
MTRPRIMVAPNGARRGQSDHAALPVTPEEIVQTARSCHAAGADAVHLHVRDAAGRHSLDAGLYREVLAALHEVDGLELQVTTEAAGRYDPLAQFACLRDLAPSWASVSVREINRSPEIAETLYGLCAEQGTRVQHIVYDAQDLALLRSWRAAGIVRPQQDEVICVLGAYTPARPGHPDELATLLPEMRGLRFSLCAFGPQEQACLITAARAGAAYLRVGFENNLHAPDGREWPDNAAAVAVLRAELERDFP